MENKLPAKNLDEQRYRVLIDNAPEAVIIFDIELERFIDANKAACTLLKFSREELLQLGPSDISLKLHQGVPSVDKITEYIQQALSGGNPAFEWIHLDRNGREIPCEVRLIRFPPYDQSIVRANVIDLTEKKKTEATLIESEERLKLALKTVGLGCFDWYPKENQTHWDVNMHELFGLAPSNPIDRNVFFFQSIHPDDKEHLLARHANILIQGSDINNFESRFRIIRNGNIVHMNSYGVIMRNEAGEVQRITGTIQDITERVLINEQLKSQATLLNQVSDAIITTDNDFVIRSWNKAAEKMYGWSATEVIGQPLRTIVPTQYINKNRDEVIRLLLQEGTWNDEVIQKNKKGEELYILASVTILKDEYGKTKGTIGVTRDISDRKQAEFALRESEAFHRAVYDNSLNAILIADNNGKLHSFNNAACDMFGFQEEALAQMSIFDLPITNLADKKRWFEKVITKRKYFGELTISLSGKEERTTQYHAIQIWDNFNMFVLVDITGRKKAKEALLQAKNFAENLIDTANVIIIGLDLSGNITIFNRAAQEITGYSQEELVGKNWFQALVPQDRYPQVWKEFQRLKDEDILARTYENPILTKGGEERIISWQNSTLYEQNKAVGAISFGIDITQRKRVEEVLKDREERFRTIFNQQFQVMVLLSPEGRVIEINDLPFKITGSPEDYIGAFVWDTPAWAGHPKWQAIIKSQVLKAGQIKETLIAEDVYVNTKGELRWADAAYTAIRNERGEVKYILVQASDITERKQMLTQLSQTQQELSELTNRFQISTRAAKIGIWDWNVQDDLLVWDKTMLEIYGVSCDKSSVQITDWQQYVYPDDLDIFQEMIRWRSIGKKELLNTEFRIQLDDGAIRNIKAVGSIQRDGQGQVLRIIGTNWDITQEKEAEQERIRSRQLEARNRELEQFAYVASHDLQEPLRTVISFVGLLKRGYQDKLDAQGHEYLQFVVDASVRMSQLIKGLLEYSRIGTNRQLSEVNIDDLIQNILDDLSAQISHTQARISVSAMPKITGYETELRLLFQNLISNAIKFRKEDQHPIIHIEAKEQKKHWLFTVSDQGIGIDPVYRKQIFSLFQRLHGMEKYEGTGIGLAHCHKIVDLHGGEIWVTSELSQGSSFFFKIAKSVKALG